MQDRAYVNVDELASILKVHPKTIYRALRRQEIPYVRVGPYYRIPVSYIGLPMPPAYGTRGRRTAMHSQQLTFFDTTKHRIWRFNL